jgi:hypothetical protein
MTNTIAFTGVAALALALVAALSPGRAMAQGAYPCSGQASYENGHYVVSNVSPAGGVDSQCEILVTPGGMQVQNGGDTHAIDGVDATHESQGHAP